MSYIQFFKKDHNSSAFHGLPVQFIFASQVLSFSAWAMIGYIPLPICSTNSIPSWQSHFFFLGGLYLAQFLGTASHNCPNPFLWFIKKQLFPWRPGWKSDPPWLSLHCLLAPPPTNNLCSCVPGILKETCPRNLKGVIKRRWTALDIHRFCRS